MRADVVPAECNDRRQANARGSVFGVAWICVQGGIPNRNVVQQQDRGHPARSGLSSAPNGQSRNGNSEGQILNR